MKVSPGNFNFPLNLQLQFLVKIYITLNGINISQVDDVLEAFTQARFIIGKDVDGYVCLVSLNNHVLINHDKTYHSLC